MTSRGRGYQWFWSLTTKKRDDERRGCQKLSKQHEVIFGRPQKCKRKPKPEFLNISKISVDSCSWHSKSSSSSTSSRLSTPMTQSVLHNKRNTITAVAASSTSRTTTAWQPGSRSRWDLIWFLFPFKFCQLKHILIAGPFFNKIKLSRKLNWSSFKNIFYSVDW